MPSRCDQGAVWLSLLVLASTGAAAERAGQQRAPAASPPASPPPVMGAAGAPREDARLARRVREEQVGGPLSEYLEAVADAAQVNLRAKPPFGERRVVALNLDTSLKRLQSALARTYGLTWSASADPAPEYTLYESARDRQGKADALAVVRRRGRERLRARWEQVRKLTFTPREQLAKLAARGDPKAKSLQNPRAVALSRLVFQLPAPVIEQFWSTGRARVNVASLAPPLQQLARESKGTERWVMTLANGQVVHDTSDPVRDGWIVLLPGGTADRPTVWACIRYGRNGGGVDGNLLESVGLMRRPPEERRQEARTRPSRMPNDARFAKPVTLKEPASRKHLEPGERPPGAKPFAAYLKDLAKQISMPIVAECEYKQKDDRWLRGQEWLAADITDRPLHEALDLLCADFEYEWHFEEGALLLRPRLWFAPQAEREYVYPDIRKINAAR